MANENDNRVLGRRGARLVNEEEARYVNGGIGTTTVCSFSPITGPDGDFKIGEC